MHGQWIWLLDIQNDFAARMDWCLESYENANHYPEITSGIPHYIKAAAGEKITLDASACTDPDGDELSYRWWHYQYAGTNPFASEIILKKSNKVKVSFTLPEDASGKQLHVILEVADSGSPVLKRYNRVVINVH